MFELHAWPLVSHQDFEDHWNDLGHARTFIEGLPFWEMEPKNSLVVGGSGNRYCFHKAGEYYAVYLEVGGAVSLDLSGVSGTFDLRWYNPTTGVFTPGGTVNGGGVVALGSPPFSGDAAVLVLNENADKAPSR